jgi:hypothetical protein
LCAVGLVVVLGTQILQKHPEDIESRNARG